MSDFATFSLYMLTFVLSAYLFSIAMKQKKQGKHYGFLLFFAALIPTILAAVRYEVGTDFTTYKNMYETIKNSSFISWVNNAEGTDKNLILLFVIAKFASLFNSHQVFFGVFALLILLFFYLGIKDRELNVSYFVVAFIFLISIFMNSFNGMRQYLAMSIVFWAIKFAEKRDIIKYLLIIIFASTIHVTSFVAIPIYFMYGETRSWGYLKNFLIIVCSFVAIMLFPKILKLIGGRYEKYDEYSGVETANLTFYLSIAWTVLFVVCYGKLSKLNRSNSLFIFMFFISLVFQGTGFISPDVKRIALYFSYPQFILMGQIPCLFAEEDRDFVNILLFVYEILIILVYSYWILGHSDLFPFNYRF